MSERTRTQIPEAKKRQRQLLREIVYWLEGDLFERVPSPEPSASCWRNPLGFEVLLSPRHDSGWAGEVRWPDGRRITTSWVDIPWLDEKLP